MTRCGGTTRHTGELSGAVSLGCRHGATYLGRAKAGGGFERTPIADGGTVKVGRRTVKAVATPGHTHHHLSYVVSDGEQQAVFSGGSLLYGSVGRTDLVSDEDTEPLTHAQYSSVRRLAAEAQPGAALYPTHGFGPFCSAGPAANAHALGDDLGAAPDALEVGSTKRDRRQGAGRVTGVDAGLLDVLDHAAAVELVTVVERVGVALDRVLPDAVHQGRGVRAADRSAAPLTPPGRGGAPGLRVRT